MGSRVGHVLVFLLGVSMTIGFYEVRRLVWNTSRAITLAQSQLAGSKELASAKRTAAREALVEQGGEEAIAQIREERLKTLAERGERAERPDRGERPDRADPRAPVSERAKEKLAARLELWKEMSPEERQAVRDRRQARMAGRQNPRATPAPERAARLGPAVDGPVQPAQGEPRPRGEADDAYLSEEDEELLYDTAFLPEDEP